jgi:hypothetical protein
LTARLRDCPQPAAGRRRSQVTPPAARRAAADTGLSADAQAIPGQEMAIGIDQGTRDGGLSRLGQHVGRAPARLVVGWPDTRITCHDPVSRRREPAKFSSPPRPEPRSVTVTVMRRAA